jgi:hypothetical protein
MSVHKATTPMTPERFVRAIATLGGVIGFLQRNRSGNNLCDRARDNRYT